MGYSIYIGNAQIRVNPEYEYIGLEAKEEHHDSAPAFGEISDYTNGRHPTYSVWADFCREVGLFELFYDKGNGLMRDHPGVSLLLPWHLEEVRNALDNRKRTNGGRPPGFWDEGRLGYIDNGNDYQLARLIWLEYWISWALENCEYPAIANS